MNGFWRSDTKSLQVACEFQTRIITVSLSCNRLSSSDLNPGMKCCSCRHCCDKDVPKARSELTMFAVTHHSLKLAMEISTHASFVLSMKLWASALNCQDGHDLLSWAVCQREDRRHCQMHWLPGVTHVTLSPPKVFTPDPWPLHPTCQEKCTSWRVSWTKQRLVKQQRGQVTCQSNVTTRNLEKASPNNDLQTPSASKKWKGD